MVASASTFLPEPDVGKKQSNVTHTVRLPTRDAVPMAAVSSSQVSVQINWHTELLLSARHCRTCSERSWCLTQSFPFTFAAEDPESVSMTQSNRVMDE